MIRIRRYHGDEELPQRESSRVVRIGDYWDRITLEHVSIYVEADEEPDHVEMRRKVNEAEAELKNERHQLRAARKMGWKTSKVR